MKPGLFDAVEAGDGSGQGKRRENGAEGNLGAKGRLREKLREEAAHRRKVSRWGKRWMAYDLTPGRKSARSAVGRGRAMYESPLRWFGAKSRLIPELLPLLPPHDTFLDLFFGGGSVTLGKPRSTVEVANDLDGEIVNFYHVMQDRTKAEELARRAEFTPYSREWFEEIRDRTEDPVDDVDRAYRFFVTNRMSFGGWSCDKRRPSWSYSVTLDRKDMSASVAVWLKGVACLMEVHERIRTVQIEREDFRVMIPRYETPETLIYADPPYLPETRVRGGYRHEMTPEDHAELIVLLRDYSGMVVLSGYANSLYSTLDAAGWTRKDFETRIFCSGKAAKKNRRTESIWLNPKTVSRLGLGLWDREDAA